MNRTSIRRAILVGIAAMALAVSGCSAANEGGSGDTGDGGGLTGTLNAGGASSQQSAQDAWRASFQQSNSGVTVNYEPVGSGTGRQNFADGGYLFAGSDSYLTDDEGELSAAKERCGGEDPIEVPNYISPIAIIYNVKGISDLNLSAPVAAQIFAGDIKKWNDPQIAALNDGVSLPATTISPVHRSDDSGTTKNFTDYLAKAGDGKWAFDPDSLWPIKGGEAAEGTSGVVAAVSGGDGTIGYADDSQAGSLGVAKIQVGDAFVAPSAEGAAQVVAESTPVSGRPSVDMAIDINRTATDGYPLLLTSYLIACQHYDSADDAALVKAYLGYVLSDEGQQEAATKAGSAPLDAAMAEKARSLVDAIAAK